MKIILCTGSSGSVGKSIHSIFQVAYHLSTNTNSKILLVDLNPVNRNASLYLYPLRSIDHEPIPELNYDRYFIGPSKEICVTGPQKGVTLSYIQVYEYIQYLLSAKNLQALGIDENCVCIIDTNLDIELLNPVLEQRTTNGFTEVVSTSPNRLAALLNGLKEFTFEIWQTWDFGQLSVPSVRTNTAKSINVLENLVEAYEKLLKTEPSPIINTTPVIPSHVPIAIYHIVNPGQYPKDKVEISFTFKTFFTGRIGQVINPIIIETFKEYSNYTPTDPMAFEDLSARMNIYLDPAVLAQSASTLNSLELLGSAFINAERKRPRNLLLIPYYDVDIAGFKNDPSNLAKCMDMSLTNLADKIYSGLGHYANGLKTLLK